MANAHIRNRPIIESLGILTGAGGCDYAAPSGANATLNAHTYIAITGLTATAADGTGGTVVTATSVDTDIWDTLTSLTIPQGVTVYGKWSSVVVTDGDKALVYRESSTD